MATTWDPAQYLRFEEERSRPFGDLISRIHIERPGRIVDLGCGPGTTTATLLDVWPEAHIVGIDSSEEMIAQAARLTKVGRLEFRRGDLRDWEPDGPVDVVLSCATLQWVPGHLDLFDRFVASLGDRGVFAFQVPGNFAAPSHVLLHELATSERWRNLLGEVATGTARSHEPAEYLEALLDTGARADVWETTYLHVLQGPDAVLEWISGTGLRPVLTILDSAEPGEKEEFLRSYAAVLRAAYPRDSHNRTIFPFRRIFGVASVTRVDS